MKKAYANLSEDIRGFKKDMRDKDHGVRASGQWQREAARKRAAAMIEVRKQSKVEAQRQYLTAKSLNADTSIIR